MSVIRTSNKDTPDQSQEKKRLAYHTDHVDMAILADQAFYMLFQEWFELNSDRDVHDELPFIRSIHRLKFTADYLLRTDCKHVLQVRSIPVVDFGFLLRHYFVRIDELVEIHPGNEEKICLRGWMRSVDIGSDCLMEEYRLCANCANIALASLWKNSKKFSFAFRNCDHNCNDSRQSIGIATTIFLILVALVSLFVQQAVLPFCLILIGLVTGYSLLSFSQSVISANILGVLGRNPAVAEVGVGVKECIHDVPMDNESLHSMRRTSCFQRVPRD